MARQGIFFPLKDAALREDVHLLGGLVGEVIREQGGDALFEAVEGDRQAAIARRQGDPDAAVQLVVRTRDRPAAEARELVRAFSTWFQAVNMAEKVHRIRRRRQYLSDVSTSQPGGIEEALVKLKARGVDLEGLRRLLISLSIEPVLAAHPTESTRRTVLRKQQRVARLLIARLTPSMTPAEARMTLERVRMEITSGWQTAENSRERLTIADEREHVLYFLVEVLYRIVPVLYEELTAAIEKVYGPEARGFEVPECLRFGSWVGGDMDGNPDVHAKTIRETLARHHALIVNSYFLECRGLAEKLSQSAARVKISPQLQARIDNYSVLLPSAQSRTPASHDRMPYRVFLGQVMERLRATYEGRQHHYDRAQQLLDDIQLIADSLEQNKGEHAGLFPVRRLVRRIRTFGFHLATLDVRQHADMHRAVVAEGLGEPQWAQHSAEERLARLREALTSDQGPNGLLSATGKRTLWVFEAIGHCRHRFGAEAIGPYVVSMARGPDDVLSVLLLARWAALAERNTGDVPLDVAPLFESQAALESAGQVMADLLADPVYRAHLAARGNHQYVMIGYSDSNKESGLVTSRWLLRRAQESIVASADAAGIDLTVFHGRTGTASRGGRVEALIRTAPPGATRGRLRITEQGESVNDKYGLRPIALRVFEQSLHALALSRAGALPVEQVAPSWREAMSVMAKEAAQHYRALVHGDPEFYDFFRQVTPIDVIERMQIGSRPASRDPSGGVRALRAIPWMSAWAQSRYLLPGWFGAGAALTHAAAQLGKGLLGEMYARWYFFEHLLDDIEQTLAKADMGIAGFYDALVDERLARFPQQIRAEYDRTRDLLLELKGCARLLDGEPTLQRSIRLRSPYVDPMHLMQVDMLNRWRESGREDRELFEALVSSVNGIAQALQSGG